MLTVSCCSFTFLCQVLFKLQMNGKVDAIEMEQVLRHLQLTQDQFISMCVIAGCDYLKNIKSIGIHKAKQFVKKENFLDELKKHKHAPANYKESFLRARNVFRHQLVYDIATKRVQPLHQWEECEDKQGSDVCGQYPFIFLPLECYIQ